MHTSKEPVGVPAGDTTETDWAALMEEPPGGPNYGRSATTDPEALGQYLPLDIESMQERDLMQQGGWGLVETSRGSGGIGTYGARDMGMTSHRGILFPGEYVDRALLKAKVEEALGFTFEQVRSVYRQGRMTAEQGELRARIDARLLALSRRGVQVHSIGKAIGLGMSAGGDGGEYCNAVRRGLERAKAAGLERRAA